MNDRTDADYIKQLANRMPPVYHSFKISDGFTHSMGYGPTFVRPPEIHLRLDFYLDGLYHDEPPIVQVGIIYCMFNNFMSERFGDVIAQYKKKLLEEPK